MLISFLYLYFVQPVLPKLSSREQQQLLTGVANRPQERFIPVLTSIQSDCAYYSADVGQYIPLYDIARVWQHIRYMCCVTLCDLVFKYTVMST